MTAAAGRCDGPGLEETPRQGKDLSRQNFTCMFRAAPKRCTSPPGSRLQGVFCFRRFPGDQFNLSGRFSPTTIASAHAHKEAKIPMKTSGRLRKQLSKLLASAE